MPAGTLHTARTPELSLAWQAHGSSTGWPVVLVHGFPYSVHAFDAVVPRLVAAGAHVLVPHLRGFGATRLHEGAPRSGQQAAIGRDLLDLLDAAGIERALLAGFDWGNRAACVVAALAPGRVQGLVSCGGYAIQDIAAAAQPLPPVNEERLGYQFYFATERGRRGLATYRQAYCEHLWRLWSPTWAFTGRQYQASAAAFDNPDFVEVVIHSYRHRLGLAAGAERHEAHERRLATLPDITVPTLVLEGDADGVAGPPRGPGPRLTGWHAHRVLKGAGHNLPQERPGCFAQAVLDLHQHLITPMETTE